MVLIAGNVLTDNLANLVRRFPSFENLPPFYREMVDIIVGIDAMRISLSRVGWASGQIREITRESLRKTKRRENRSSIRKEAFGRMSSVIKSISNDLDFLNDARNKIRKLPSIDPMLPTILIAGYPNVGKSSFMIQVTGARPEIASYPFTTQGIYLGHFSRDHQRYQVVDTPGLLDRPFSERNVIERQSIAVLRHLQGVVLYIIDPSEHSGFPLESQLRLGDDIKSWIKLPILVVVNKADLLPYSGFPHMSTLTGDGVLDVLERLISILKSKSSVSLHT